VKKLFAVVVILAVLGSSSRGYDWWSYNLNNPGVLTKQAVVVH
jgi:hypothetical protein